MENYQCTLCCNVLHSMMDKMLCCCAPNFRCSVFVIIGYTGIASAAASPMPITLRMTHTICSPVCCLAGNVLLQCAARCSCCWWRAREAFSGRGRSIESH